MEKTFLIGGRDIKLKACAGVLVVYKSQFGIDYADDLNLTKNNFEKLVEVGYKFLWSMAKCADNSLIDPDKWLLSFPKLNLIEILPVVNEFFKESIDIFRIDKKVSASEGNPLSAEYLLALANICGFGFADVYNMPLGLLLNVIDEYIIIKTGKEKNNVRMATQADFDRF